MALVFGPSPITDDLLGYLRTEVRRRATEQGLAEAWQDALKSLIEEVLREGPPCERVVPALRFNEMLRWSANAELALLAMLQYCVVVTQQLTKIDWPDPRACGTWLARLRSANTQTRVHLGFAYLHNANLFNANLFNANLSGADLRGSNITPEQLATTRGTPGHLPDDPDD